MSDHDFVYLPAELATALAIYITSLQQAVDDDIDVIKSHARSSIQAVTSFIVSTSH